MSTTSDLPDRQLPIVTSSSYGLRNFLHKFRTTRSASSSAAVDNGDAKFTRWNMGMLNDKETNEVPGSILLMPKVSHQNQPLGLARAPIRRSPSSFRSPFAAGLEPGSSAAHQPVAQTIEEEEKKKTSDGRIILEPQPDDSLNDPLNWPSWRRDTALLSLGFYCMVGGGMTPILAAGFNDVAKTYGVPATKVALTTGFFMLGLGLGSVLASPTAIILGKRPVYLVGAILFCVSAVWCAASPNYPSLVVGRIFMGLAVSPVECMPSATIAEIFFLHERAYRLGIYTLLLLGGKNLFPLISASIIQGLSWQWVFWIVAVVVGFCFVLLFLFVPETFWDRTPRPRVYSGGVKAAWASIGAVFNPSRRSVSATTLGAQGGDEAAGRMRSANGNMVERAVSRSNSKLAAKQLLQNRTPRKSYIDGGDRRHSQQRRESTHSPPYSPQSGSLVDRMNWVSAPSTPGYFDLPGTGPDRPNNARSPSNRSIPWRYDEASPTSILPTPYTPLPPAQTSPIEGLVSQHGGVGATRLAVNPPDLSTHHPAICSVEEKSVSAEPATHLPYTHHLRTQPPKSYRQTLKPWNGRLRNDSWFKAALRPFILFAYPSILWSTIVYSLSVGWLIVLSESVSAVYRDASSYHFTALQTGLVYLSPFLGGILGTAVAGKCSDIIVRFLSRRNGGLYEPEFRLVMALPVVLSTCLGLMGFGWSAAERDSWIVPTVFFGVISFGCSLGSTTAITFAVDSYRQYAGEALVTLNFSKNVFHGLVFSLFFPEWLQADGSKSVFLIIGGIQLACLMTTVPMYIFGKRLRMWTVRKNMMERF